MTIIGFLALCLAFCIVPVLIVEIVAAVMAIRAIHSCRQTRRALIAPVPGARGRKAGWDQRPTRADRRLLARSLDAAIDHCVITSLLPNTMVRAHSIVEAFRRASEMPRSGR